MSGAETNTGAGRRPPYLSDDDLRGLGLSPVEIADAIEKAAREAAEGQLWAAPKAAVMPGDGRYTMATLSTGSDPALTVVKSVTSNPASPDRGLPAINGAILVLDGHTGLLRATLDAGWITAVRTAGISAVAARRLADPQARSIGFVGCGVQAHSHLDAFAAEYPLAEALAFGRGQASTDRLLDACRAKGLEARQAASAEAVLREADIVVTSVPLDYTMTPFLDAAWLRPGAFAAIVDLSIPWKQETMGAFGELAIDDHAQEAVSERKLVPPGTATADLGQLVAGPSRFDAAQSAAFAFRGMALGDFAVAALCATRAA
jgi:ornithine cyclodeaminase/alanine dehydrogenase